MDTNKYPISFWVLKVLAALGVFTLWSLLWWLFEPNSPPRGIAVMLIMLVSWWTVEKLTARGP